MYKVQRFPTCPLSLLVRGLTDYQHTRACLYIRYNRCTYKNMSSLHKCTVYLKSHSWCIFYGLEHTVTCIPLLQDHTQWFRRHGTLGVPLAQEPLGTKQLFTALVVLTFRELHVESYILFRLASFTWWASPVAQTVRTCPRCGRPGFTMDRGAWRATVHGVAETQTQLSN